MESTFFAVDVTTAYVYAVMFVLLFLIGYIKSASDTFELTDEAKDEFSATAVWIPIVHYMVWARLGGVKKLGIVACVTCSLTTAGLIVTAVLSIVAKKLVVEAVVLTAVIYIVNAVVDFFIFSAFFNKYKRNISTGVVLFASFVPLFKYYLPFKEDK